MAFHGIPRKRLIEALLWAGFLALAGFQLSRSVSRAGAAEVAAVEVETIDGERLALADLRGRVVLVNFWATWCPPCREEMPGFQRVYERYRDRGFTIVGLSTDVGTPDLVRGFLDAHGIGYPIAMATGEVERAFGPMAGLPTSFLIDRDGVIRQTVVGAFPEDALERAVGELLAE